MIHKHIVYSPFLDWKFKISKAAGSHLWDETGREFIDFTSGWNVANLGWNHPEVAEAMRTQVGKNTFTAMWTSDEAQESYAENLARVLPKDLGTFVRATGGTEANEKALLMARAVTGRKKIIGFRDTYHGQSFGTMSIGYRPEYVQMIAPVVPEFIQIDFPSSYVSKKSDKETLDDFLTVLEGLLKKRDVAAIVTEAGIITGWGSCLVAPQGYLPAVRKLTRQYGTLLILDEVGTGFSRCGKLFGMELEEVVPDFATFAKGITNGVAAMGAVAVHKDLPEKIIQNAKIHSTFGWMSVACAAASAVLSIHMREKVWLEAGAKGLYLLDTLKRELHDKSLILDVYGKGMEIGVMCIDIDSAKQIQRRAYESGLHLAPCDDVLQIMPPLTTSKSILREGIDILVESVHDICNQH